MIYDTTIDSGMPDTTRATTSTLWVSAERTPFIKCMTPTLLENAEIQWARLTAYYYYYDYVSSGMVNISAHQVTGGDWNQYTLTWNGVADLPNLGLSMTTLSFVSAAAGNATINNPGRADFYITPVFQAWVNNPSINYGIALRYMASSTNKSVIFHSANSASGHQPKINYQYRYEADEIIRLFSVANEGHEHYSALSYTVNSFLSYGYSNALAGNGEFLPETFKAELLCSTIVATRSHGITIMRGNNVLVTGLQLNDNEDTPYYFFGSPYSISGAITAGITDNDSYANLNLSLFIGCNTALSGINGPSLPSAVVDHHARVSVGFSESIYCNDANTWTMDFFDCLLDGQTVQEAVTYACSLATVQSGLKSAVIFGDSSYRLGN